MPNTTITFPNSVPELKKMVVLYHEEIELLREQVRHLKSQLFTPKSEKLSDPVALLQRSLFEVEEEAKPESKKPENDDEMETVTYRRKKKKKGRKPLPEELPREEVVHDLKPEEKVCPCGHEMSRFGEEVREELDFKPAELKVLRHIRYKYACKSCQGAESDEGAVKTAPAPPRLLPHSIAAPGLLAQVITAKFADGLPFYRVERQFQRLGLGLKRATMCYWGLRISERLEPLWEMLLAETQTYPWLQVDETTIQVLGEAGRSNRAKSYMWVIRGGPPPTLPVSARAGPPTLVFYFYHPKRSSKVAAQLMEGYQGLVQTDGYEGYGFLDTQAGVRHAGCWSHTRRKFVAVVKAIGKRKKTKKTYAEQTLDKIRELYAIERQAKQQKMTPAAVRELRQREAKPRVEALHAWLVDLADKTPPKGLLGKAVDYALKQWPRLLVYLDHGALPIDTNPVENAIRPFVIGRKAWLFSGHPNGAKASAILFTFVETAKANGWEPYAYLNHLFRRLPSAQTEAEQRALLPTQPPPDLAPVE